MANKKPRITLDNLANGTLPKHVIQAISSMELSVKDLAEYEGSKNAFNISVRDGSVRVEINKTFSLGKALTVIGTAATTAWILFQIVTTYLL